MLQPAPLLTMQGIYKTFPGVKALKNVDFSLRAGEIHALMGENGAGKSTLIKVLTGVEQPDAGKISLAGQPIQARSPLHAQTLGISTVYQEVNLCPNLSVAENIFIGREPKKFGLVDWKELNRRARQLLLDQMDLNLEVTQTLGSYSVALQQMVAIARALVVSAKVLILDEPTSSLDENETEKLFQVIRKLKGDGMGIIFITHFLDQVYAIADRITVLRNGELVGAFETADLPRVQLVAKMIGKELEDLDSVSKAKQHSAGSAHPLLEVHQVGRTGSIKPFDLELNAGEVLGLAGLLGSGRTEIARLLFGIDPFETGVLKINGRSEKTLSPLKSILSGLGLCPENRKADGIIDDLTVRENIILALQASRGWFKYIPFKQQSEIAERYIKALNISTPSAEQLIRNLSGGNQQKVILARWLATNPQILILDEPTRGIDIGAKTEIQKLVLALAGEGKAIVFISSELEEVIRCSHRVMILRDRQKVGELAGDQINEGQILHTIAGR